MEKYRGLEVETSGVKELTRKEIVTKAFSQGFIHILPEEREVFLTSRYVNVDGENPPSQKNFTELLGVKTPVTVGRIEDRSIAELSNMLNVLDGREADPNWVQNVLPKNSKALEYLYYNARGNKVRAVARSIGRTEAYTLKLLKSKGIVLGQGQRTPLRIEYIFGDDPAHTIRFYRLRSYVWSEIAELFGLHEATLRKIARTLGVDKVKADKSIASLRNVK